MRQALHEYRDEAAGKVGEFSALARQRADGINAIANAADSMERNPISLSKTTHS